MTEGSAPGSIDDLLDRALDAIKRGDVETARGLAHRVLGSHADNLDASGLLSVEPSFAGELRRLTIMFCDLVGSTALSARHDPERYRGIVARYKRACRQVVEERYGGHITQVKGDGLLVVFGHPAAHEDDVLRAVRAGLDVIDAVHRLSARAEDELGESLAARVAVHKGLVYLDTDEDEIYGLAANVAARLQELAAPASLVISDDVRRLLGDRFDTEAQAPEKVKGLDRPLASWRVVGERSPFPRPRRWPTPLVGRAGERERLRAAWRSRPGGVLVRGEAGIGKSRLAGELAAEVAEAGGRLVELAGSPLHAGAGFHPLRALADARCGIGRDTDGPERLRLLRLDLSGCGLDADELVPLLGPVLRVEPDAGYAPAASSPRKLQDEISDAAGRYLRAALGTGPALLVVDDLHWCDDSTRAVIAALVGDPPRDLLVVMTTRDGDAPPPAPGVEVVDLCPLPDADCAALVAALDPAGITGPAHDRLIERSDGVPLYLEELVRAALEPPEGHDESRDAGPASGADLPDVLYEPLLARLYTTRAGVQVAAAAATIGRHLDRDLLARAADIPGADLDAALDALLGGSILEPDGGPGRYRFRHELLREVAYGLQPGAARQAVHGRVADALAETAGAGGAADWLVLAGHQAQAGRPREAIGCYEQAADEAQRRGALGEARQHLGLAAGLVWALPPGPGRTDREMGLLLRRGFLAVSAEGNTSPQAAADYERCLELALDDRSGGDRVLGTLISLFGYYASRADFPRARQLVEVIRSALSGRSEWLRPINEAGFGMLDWYGGRFAEAHDRLEAALPRTFPTAEDERVRLTWFLPNDPLALMYTHLALGRFVRGDPPGAQAALAEAERLAAGLPFPEGPFSAAYNRTYAAWMQIQLGELDRAEVLIEETLALAETHGYDFWIVAALTQRAGLDVARACRADPVDRAALAGHATTLAGLIPIWEAVGARLFLPTVVTTLGTALGAAGDAEEGRRRLDESLALSAEIGSRFYDAETLRVRALLAGEPAATVQGLCEALDLARRQGAVVFELRIARDLHLTGDPAGRAALDEALGRFPPGVSYHELDEARAVLAAAS